MKLKLLMALVSILTISCSKWLDEKSNLSDVTPSTLKDYQALLDNERIMTESFAYLGQVGSDNYYVTFPTWQSLSTKTEQNSYIWNSEIFEGEPFGDWDNLYAKVAHANIVLEGLPEIPKTTQNEAEWNAIKGSALFFRSFAFYDLAQVYAKPYSPATSSTDLGIPIRLSSDVNIPSTRSTLKQTYDQILNDLTEAEALLPLTVASKIRPSKIAAQGLLARVYLSMENYEKALLYAQLALNNHSTLLDFNAVIGTPTFPFPTFQNNNQEVVFYAQSANYGIMSLNTAKVDTALYDAYQNSDLRKSLFYRHNGVNGISFRGSYTGINAKFSGIAVNELYLISAEANARLGNLPDGLTALNTLLKKRFKTGTYTLFDTQNPDVALAKILQERRKELPFTGNLRWEDLRRLNKDLQYAKTLIRVLDGNTYSLPPNDKRYVYPIPEQDVKFYGLEQNPRQ